MSKKLLTGRPVNMGMPAMTNLTEQWKKGELESGWYYVNFYSVGAVMQEYLPEHNGFGYDEKNLIQEVLAPVPSYEEWQNMLKKIELNKQAAQKAKKMLSDWFNCANHKLKAYECISELNKIAGEKE